MVILEVMNLEEDMNSIPNMTAWLELTFSLLFIALLFYTHLRGFFYCMLPAEIVFYFLPMIKKSRFSVMRAMILSARKNNIVLERSDERVGYMIQMHAYFIWNNEREFSQFVDSCIKGLSNQVSLNRLKRAG